MTDSINVALAEHGLCERRPDSLHHLIGVPLALIFAELTGHAHESPLVTSCIRSYRSRYAEVSLRDTTVVPGMRAALTVLRRSHRLAIATSKALPITEPILSALRLRGLFDVVVGPDLGAPAEEKEVTIGNALSSLGRARAVMVGDRSFDVVGAHANSLPAIGVTWGIGGADELLAAGVDAIIHRTDELVTAVTSLLHGAGP